MPAKPAASAAKPPAAKTAAGKPAAAPANRNGAHINNNGAAKPEHKILFQKFFRSVGPRTYAAQIKEATNGNHYLVLTEGKREEGSDEVKKMKLFVYSEDFGLFFRMLHETAQWIRANPVPDEVKKRRQRYWEKHGSKSDSAGPMEPPVEAAATRPATPAAARGASRPRPTNAANNVRHNVTNNAKPAHRPPPSRGRSR